jgi:hypothetical protein
MLGAKQVSQNSVGGQGKLALSPVRVTQCRRQCQCQLKTKSDDPRDRTEIKYERLVIPADNWQLTLATF